MAGSFGFEQDHYDISVRIGERVLLPEVRQAAADTLIVADGFSCREQILQTTGRQAWHPVEIVSMAIDAGGRRLRPQNGPASDTMALDAHREPIEAVAARPA